MDKKDYIAPKVRVKEIEDEKLLAASEITEKPGDAPEGGGFDADAKSSIWHNSDNE